VKLLGNSCYPIESAGCVKLVGALMPFVGALTPDLTVFSDDFYEMESLSSRDRLSISSSGS
jgi:hypothetical protein